MDDTNDTNNRDERDLDPRAVNGLATQWRPGQSGNPTGRPRGFVSTVVHGLPTVSTVEVVSCMRMMLMLTEAQIRDVLGDPNLTQMERIILEGLVDSSKATRSAVLRDLLTRVIPPMRQEIQVDATVVQRQEIDLPDGNKLIV